MANQPQTPTHQFPSVRRSPVSHPRVEIQIQPRSSNACGFVGRMSPVRVANFLSEFPPPQTRPLDTYSEPLPLSTIPIPIPTPVPRFLLQLMSHISHNVPHPILPTTIFPRLPISHTSSALCCPIVSWIPGADGVSSPGPLGLQLRYLPDHISLVMPILCVITSQGWEGRHSHRP